jgi:OOP family OmpA-OmpF porin
MLAGTLAFGPGDEDDAMHRFAPENHMLELGVWGGLLIPSRAHELYDPVNTTHERFRVVAPDLGLRFAYFPLRFLGAEIEGGLMPTRTEADQKALLYTGRGHVIGQLPWWRLTPFLLAGGGVMGVSSGAGAGGVGKDVDRSFHWGPGAKFFINRWLAVRLDFRHLVGARQGVDAGPTSHFEVLAGLSVTFRTQSSDDGDHGGDHDPDGDGFWGSEDQCPEEAGTYPDGCPAEDRDGDGVADTDDQCPDEPGEGPSGCPAADRDGDGVSDEADECPDEMGSKPKGCPLDSDGDGVDDHEDACPNEPESDNGYEDEDGCPDELPTQLKGAAGVMPGITFEVNSAKITAESKPALDHAVETLKNNPKYVVRVEGHTDASGDRQHNLDLSQKRADAVRDYMVEHGVETGRITTRGYGPDRPKAGNDTEAGRAENRRIEFKLRRGRARKGDRE